MTLIYDYLGLSRVISGGQTGADQGGLVAARNMGVRTGGYAPKGWRTQNGSNPLLQVLDVIEDDSDDYLPRTEKNVKTSHATLLIGVNLDSPGCRATIRFCSKHSKPTARIQIPNSVESSEAFYADIDAQVEKAYGILSAAQVGCLNVAGNRELSVGTSVFDVTVYAVTQLLKHFQANNLLRPANSL